MTEGVASCGLAIFILRISLGAQHPAYHTRPSAVAAAAWIPRAALAPYLGLQKERGGQTGRAATYDELLTTAGDLEAVEDLLNQFSVPLLPKPQLGLAKTSPDHGPSNKIF